MDAATQGQRALVLHGTGQGGCASSFWVDAWRCRWAGELELSERPVVQGEGAQEFSSSSSQPLACQPLRTGGVFSPCRYLHDSPWCLLLLFLGKLELRPGRCGTESHVFQSFPCCFPAFY